MTCSMPKPESIDYYGILESGAAVSQGDTVVFGFRAQAFVTRAFVVPCPVFLQDSQWWKVSMIVMAK